MEHFFSPDSDEDQTKKKVFISRPNGTLFLSTDLRSDAHQSQIIGGDADEDYTQIVGGYTVKLLDEYIPPSPPGFGTTVHVQLILPRRGAIFLGGHRRRQKGGPGGPGLPIGMLPMIKKS